MIVDAILIQFIIAYFFFCAHMLKSANRQTPRKYFNGIFNLFPKIHKFYY